jgi:hypothetical protein
MEGQITRVDFNRRELHLIKLWWLSCEDMMIPEGSCLVCEFQGECSVIRKKLYGRNGGRNGTNRYREPEKTEATTPGIPVEEYFPS